MVFLCGSFLLYPLLAKFIAPVVGISFLVSSLIVSFGLFRRRLRIPHSFLVYVWAAYLAVYLVWSFIAAIHGNSALYAYQDSAGFVLYLCFMPVVYFLVNQNNLHRSFFVFIERICQLIAIVSIALFLVMYFVLGGISSESILLIHSFAYDYGLSWKIGHSDGMFGVYSNVAHFLLLGNALVLYRFYATRRYIDLLWIVFYILALFLDGRRGLAFSAFLQMLIVAPFFLKKFTIFQRTTFLLVASVVLASLVFTNLDWIQQRFTFTESDPSSFERYAQIPALLDKISQNPFFGGGFGSVAAYIRSNERPFSYEVDFLATFMKLGFLGGVLYFGTYLLGVAQALRIRDPLGLFLISAGLPFFFYMGTNGNLAMSTDSSIFHIFLFLMIAFTLPVHPTTKLQSIPFKDDGTLIR